MPLKNIAMVLLAQEDAHCTILNVIHVLKSISYVLMK